MFRTFVSSGPRYIDKENRLAVCCRLVRHRASTNVFHPGSHGQKPCTAKAFEPLPHHATRGPIGQAVCPSPCFQGTTRSTWNESHLQGGGTFLCLLGNVPSAKFDGFQLGHLDPFWPKLAAAAHGSVAVLSRRVRSSDSSPDTYQCQRRHRSTQPHSRVISGLSCPARERSAAPVYHMSSTTCSFLSSIRADDSEASMVKTRTPASVS